MHDTSERPVFKLSEFAVRKGLMEKTPNPEGGRPQRLLKSILKEHTQKFRLLLNQGTGTWGCGGGAGLVKAEAITLKAVGTKQDYNFI